MKPAVADVYFEPFPPKRIVYSFEIIGSVPVRIYRIGYPPFAAVQSRYESNIRKFLIWAVYHIGRIRSTKAALDKDSATRRDSSDRVAYVILKIAVYQ